MNQKILTNIVILVVALIVLAGAGVGYFVFKKSVLKQSTQEQQKTVDRRIYKNDLFGFSLNFPETWKGYIVNAESQSWGNFGQTEEAILFGLPEQKDLFVIYPFPLAKIQELKINKLNPIDSLGPIDYAGENNQYVFYFQTAHDFVNDEMVQRLQEINVLSNFRTY